ncbi:MAG: hypothetical protein ACREIF_13415 [Chthoniobacterales bacterium]
MMIKSLPLLLAASAAFLTLAGLMVWVVARLLRSNREQIVASGPLAAEQEFALREPATLLLMVEVPRFGSNFRELKFEVIEKATGQSTKLSYDFVRAQGAVYGVSTMRVPLGRITVQRPGPYLVRITGLPAPVDDSRSHILFSRPYLGRMALQIIGIVICAIGMLLSLLLALWQVLPLQHG